MVVDHDDLNANTRLLNVANGTIDIETRDFRPHRRDDLLTQLANVHYDENAECPQWEAALKIIFDGDESLVRYVRQILGYSLFGAAGEAILPMAFGSGSNGKSFIWNTIVKLAGDYGCVANDSLLLGDKNAHATEKASLYQKRIVAVSEPEQGCRMKESRVKELTGEAFVTARRMREDFWTFRRTHTFWLSTNHLPRVSGTDDGIWRRIKVIRFPVDLRDKVKPIKNYHLQILEQEGAGVLNWLLNGYRDYEANGFAEPDAVTQHGQTYRGEQDHLAQFVTDCCIESPNCSVRGKDLYAAYEQWGGRWSMTAFGKEMSNRFEKEKPSSGPNRNCVIYRGVGLVADDL